MSTEAQSSESWCQHDPRFHVPDAERMRALAEFAAGAGHEINNPLATILGRAQQLLRDEGDPQRRQSLAIIAAQALRIRDMIGDVMTFARPPKPEWTKFDAIVETRAVLSRLASPLEAGRCTVTVAVPESLLIVADVVQFAVVLSELVRNAITALQPTGGEVAVTWMPLDDAAELTIADHGCGFSATEREHAFDPFFSGRQAGRGLGFGLCKVARIVDQHGGTIAIASSPAGRTNVTVRWPLVLPGS